jgi:hypothetical protein
VVGEAAAVDTDVVRAAVTAEVVDTVVVAAAACPRG